MTLFAQSTGTRTAYPLVLTTTNETDLFPAIANQRIVTLESIQVSCGSVATAFTLRWDNGTTIVKLVNAKVIAANDVFQITDLHPPLSRGGRLTCQAGAANELEVMCVTIDTFPTGNMGAGVAG